MRRKVAILIVVLALVLAVVFSMVELATAAPRACPEGKVTCQEWCSMHPERTTCMTGHPNSCDKKPQGARTCVRM